MGKFFESSSREQGPKHQEKEQPPFDSIVLMTYGSAAWHGGRRSKIDPNYALNYENKMAALAGAEALKEGLGGKIVILAEQTYFDPRKDVPPPLPETDSGSLLKEYLLSRGVPEDRIEIHKYFNNTNAQVRGTKELEKEGDIKKALVISFDFHEPRVEENFKQMTDKETQGRESFISVEELLKGRDRRYAPVIERWANSPDMKKFLRMERLVVRPLTYLDRGGHLQNLLIKLQGVRAPVTTFPMQRPKPKPTPQ